MKVFWKILSASLLLASLLMTASCAKVPQTVPQAEATPSPEATFTPAPTTTPTPTPTPTVTPSPSPTATPTPTPTPTPIPLARRDFEGEVAELLPLLRGTPEPTPTVAPLASPNPLAADVGQIGAMVFAHVPILEYPSDSARVLGRESYHLFYIHNIYKRFYRVTTQEGLSGYIKASQCAVLSAEEVEGYLSAARELWSTTDFYSPDAFVAELQKEQDEGTMAERILAALGRLGLDFEPFYYGGYAKELDNDERYPLFYKDDVYNSLLFKLFNTSGTLVYYENQPTQWEYVAAGKSLERGDILFFTDALPKNSSAVLDGYEFVVAGRYSGALTSCGVYLGDDEILLLRGGRVKTVAYTKELKDSLDCARRIHINVYDDKQLIIEDMIAQIYDCLGTPYNNIRRKGEYSFDCSGLISWLFMRMEISPTSYGYRAFTGTTASGLSNITDYYWHRQKRIHLERLRARDMTKGLPSMDMLERGDLVFLRKYKNWGHVGHVMVYLGEGKVIHSTTIDPEYSGTVVANFRPELQRLYQTALRIESITLLPTR